MLSRDRCRDPLRALQLLSRPYYVHVEPLFLLHLQQQMVLPLRAPLNPTVPADAQQSVSPPRSVNVTIVLLNDALTCTIALPIFLRTFFLAIILNLYSLVRLHIIFAGTLRSISTSSIDYPFTPFLPATVFLRPFRVRALHRVLCPRTGSPLR